MNYDWRIALEEFEVAMNICDYCAFSPAFCDGEPEGCFARLSERKLKELIERRREGGKKNERHDREI